MKILVTGSAGFIGIHLCLKLTSLGYYIIGVDILNNYYDVQLKKDRLNLLSNNKYFTFYNTDICNYHDIESICKSQKVDLIINLAAQAGVRYSIDNPMVYQKSNIEGFLNILEVCRNLEIKKLIFASSSSVYGNSTNEYFSEKDNVDKPISLYAATKKSNELMAHVYSHLFNINAVGLRFFTVYGPWGRPDMAYFKFLKALECDEPIQVYNNGDLMRDFTYIDDIIDGIIATIDYNETKFEIFNLGNNNPVKLMDFISIIESLYGKTFKKELVKMQDGDVYKTSADISLANKKLLFYPKVDIKSGLESFINWYKYYYKC